MSESVGEFEYNKKDLIGHGAFAVVFKGRKKQNPEFVVAVKVITKKNLSKSQNLLAKEIKILKELKHENVVCLFDCQENQTQVNLVMEYCNGGDLADYLQVKGTLSEDTICFFLTQMASAMKALNSKGIVHRDLKPQNILLSHTTKANNPQPSKIKIKIADFGFARFLHGDMMAATLCGSPMYMAPEVIMSRQYDAKADLWSLGTIIFQCLTGKAPFQASSPQGLKKFYERNKVISPNIPAGTSQYLEDLLFRLLRRSPKDRVDFDEFFTHPFLTGKAPSLPSTPVAVPGRQRAYSTSSRGIRSPGASPGIPSSPNYEAEVLGDVRVDILTRMTPPYDIGETSPRSGPSPQGGWSGTVQKSLDERPVQEEELDFVMVPDDVGFASGEGDRLGGRGQANMSDPVFPVCSSPPQRQQNTSQNRVSPVQSSSHPKKGSIFTVGSPSSSPSSPPTVKPSPVSPPTVKTQGSPQFKSSQTTSPSTDHRTPNNGNLHHAHTSPSQLAGTGHQSRLSSMVQKGSRPNVISSPVIPVNTFKNNSPAISTAPRRRTVSDCAAYKGIEKEQPSVPFSAPADTGPVQQQAQVTSKRNKPLAVKFRRAISECTTSETAKFDKEGLEVPTNFSPILAAFAQQSEVCNRGVSPLPFSTLAGTHLVTPGRQMTRVQSSPAILAMGMQLSKPSKILGNAFPALPSPVFQPLPKAITSFGLQFGLGTSPPARQSSSPSSLPTIPGSPTKKCKDFDRSLSEPNCQQMTSVCTGSSPPRCTVSLGKKITKGFSEEQPQVTCGGCGSSLSYKGSELIYGTSPPNMEGPICLVPPELPEDTLLETEHTDGLVKLNFSLSLCKAILETAAANTAILSRALTDSLYTKQSDVSHPDQLGYLSEENRRLEESVLYFKTLKILNEALKFAKREIAAGRMKPSSAVKKVVKELNEKNHQVLKKAKDMRHHMTSGMTLGGVKLLTISANKLMYNYALQLCQSAALDELFGNPRECRERYETAKVLLQGLQDDVHKEADQILLTKYKTAINTRLTLLHRRPSVPGPCIVSEIK